MSKKKYTSEYKLSLIERLEKGESKRCISVATGVSSSTLKKWQANKDFLLNDMLAAKKSKKSSNRKRKYNESLKKIIIERVAKGESVYRISRELNIPYPTVKNWVIAAQNETKAEAEAIAEMPGESDGIIMSEDEKREFLSYINENPEVLETTRHIPEDYVDNDNEEPVSPLSETTDTELLKLRIRELEEENAMLKKAAILFSQNIKF